LFWLDGWRLGIGLVWDVLAMGVVRIFFWGAPVDFSSWRPGP